ncbi:MAG: hypothetical protein ORN54_00850 [Cyclobacteriaceae bacterium]|nr:hypothetical protein [Cyclobacteriaceae bacterium]
MLAKMSNPLLVLSKIIDIKMFRHTLEDKLLNTDKKAKQVQNPLMW